MDEQSKLEKRRSYDREWKKQYRLKNPDKVKSRRTTKSISLHKFATSMGKR